MAGNPRRTYHCSSAKAPETPLQPSTPQSTCPSENAIAQFLEGSLPAESRALLEAHVEVCSACDGALSELGRLLASATPSMTPPAGAPPQGGARYTIASTMGAGGFGRVYDAYDVLLRRRVALKFLHSDSGSASGADRMLAEARALASLSHPNVVQIYDVDVDGPSVFMAMELVEGETLASWLRTAAPRPLDERLAIVRSVAEALVTAHRASILHRDVKPDNVLLGRDGRVRLGDFGLACHAEAPPAHIGGTPWYMAPEVRAGAPASALADQYAFALLARECVFGVPPGLSSSSPPAGSDAPAALWSIFAKAAAPVPQHRYPSMEALHHAFQGALHWDRSPHATGAMAVQAIMSFVYAAVSAFSVWALLSDDVPETSLRGGHAALASMSLVSHGDSIDAVTLLYNAVGALLVVLLVSGWMPLAAIWGVVNAWALARKRSWARTSTLAYGVLSLLTLIGTPAGAYLVYAMVRTRRNS